MRCSFHVLVKSNQTKKKQTNSNKLKPSPLDGAQFLHFSFRRICSNRFSLVLFGEGTLPSLS